MIRRFDLRILLVMAVLVFVGMAKNWLFCSENTLAASSVLEKKSLLVDGDSIAYGKTGQTENGKKVVYSFAHYLHEKYGMSVKNVAVSGSRYYRSTDDEKRMSRHLVDGVKNKKYDYILLEGGSNDVHAYKNSTSKSFNELRAYLTTVTSNKNWESAKIGFVIVPHPNYKVRGYSSAMPGYEKTFWDKVKKICNEFSIPVTDLYSKNWLDEKGGTVDGLHPTVSTQKKMGKEIASWMESLPNYKYEVKFDLNGLSVDKAIETQMVVHGGKATNPIFMVRDSKQIFKHWSTKKGGSAYSFSSAVNDNIVLYAVYDVAKVDEDVSDGDNGKLTPANGSVDPSNNPGNSSPSPPGSNSSPSGSSPSSPSNPSPNEALDAVIRNADVCNNSEVSQTVKDAAGCSEQEASKLEGSVVAIIDSVILVLGLVAVVVIITGGVQFMTSTGDAGKVAKAKMTILYAVIGLIICALSYVIVNWVIGVVS